MRWPRRSSMATACARRRQRRPADKFDFIRRPTACHGAYQPLRIDAGFGGNVREYADMKSISTASRLSLAAAALAGVLALVQPIPAQAAHGGGGFHGGGFHGGGFHGGGIPRRWVPWWLPRRRFSPWVWPPVLRRLLSRLLRVRFLPVLLLIDRHQKPPLIQGRPWRRNRSVSSARLVHSSQRSTVFSTLAAPSAVSTVPASSRNLARSSDSAKGSLKSPR